MFSPVSGPANFKHAGNNIDFSRDPYKRGSAQQSCRKFSDLAQLQHSVATEMGLDFQCGCGPSLYHIKINQYFIFLTFAETVYQCITIFI